MRQRLTEARDAAWKFALASEILVLTVFRPVIGRGLPLSTTTPWLPAVPAPIISLLFAHFSCKVAWRGLLASCSPSRPEPCQAHSHVRGSSRIASEKRGWARRDPAFPQDMDFPISPFQTSRCHLQVLICPRLN